MANLTNAHAHECRRHGDQYICLRLHRGNYAYRQGNPDRSELLAECPACRLERSYYDADAAITVAEHEYFGGYHFAATASR